MSSKEICWVCEESINDCPPPPNGNYWERDCDCCGAEARKECKPKEGDDVLELTEGIIGMRGFVPLETPLVFCSSECLKDSYNGSKGRVVQKPKIP